MDFSLQLRPVFWNDIYSQKCPLIDEVEGAVGQNEKKLLTITRSNPILGFGTLLLPGSGAAVRVFLFWRSSFSVWRQVFFIFALGAPCRWGWPSGLKSLSIGCSTACLSSLWIFRLKNFWRLWSSSSEPDSLTPCSDRRVPLILLWASDPVLLDIYAPKAHGFFYFDCSEMCRAFLWALLFSA